MTAQIQRLTNDQEPWTRRLGNGTTLHVRVMPRRHFGVWYLVWVSRRRPKHYWCSRKIAAMTAQTAGKKARSLVTKYGDPS
jgi:hypothetical protein